MNQLVGDLTGKAGVSLRICVMLGNQGPYEGGAHRLSLHDTLSRIWIDGNKQLTCK